MKGNFGKFKEFYEYARYHLGYLFDSTDYGVAEALVCGCYCAYGQVYCHQLYSGIR